MNLLKKGRLGVRQLVPMVIFLVVVAVGFLLPRMVSAYSIMLLINIMMYVVLATSWTIFSGPTKYMSLATAAFFGLGYYVPVFAGHVPLPVMMLIGGAASFVIAFLLGAVTLRLRGVYFTIFTFCLVQLLNNLILWIALRVFKQRGWSVDSVHHETAYYYILGMLVILLIAAFFIKRTRFGMALLSIGESEDAAEHIGVNTTMVKILAFSLSAFWAGAVGTAIATRVGYVDPTVAFDLLKSFLPVLMVIFGGSSSLAGPIIGAVVFSYISEILSTRFPSYNMITLGIIMVIAILFLPDGLVGLAQKIISKLRSREVSSSANT